MKLHLACGTVYLKGWTNVDIEQPGYFLAKDRPDLVEINETDLEHYYKHYVTTEEFKKGVFHEKESVVDVFADIRDLPFEKNSVDKILAVHVFEHFDSWEAKRLLIHWRELLKDGGTLRIHVPDLDGIMKEYVEFEDIEWIIRQIYGSQKNEYAMHKYGYTYGTLSKLLKEFGFKKVKSCGNINDYPAFGLEATK
jgi:predicted SAM-dependent methyltransferase